jgi:hypothetical protein
MSQKRMFEPYEALRYGLVRRLLHARLSEETADRWVVAWEVEAQRRGLDPSSPDWWRPAWQWIVAERAKPA